MIMRNSVFGAILTALVVLTGCQKETAPVAAAPAPVSNLKLVAGVQDIMALQIDPAADAIWESVSTTVTKDGTHEHKPLSDKEWILERGRALMLIEGANLLLMDGRRIAREGVMVLEDHGTPGNLSAEESQAVLDANRDVFIGFAKALRDVGEQFL
jgi:hypothetical protein